MVAGALRILCTGSELTVLNGVHFQRQRIIRHQLPHGFSGEWSVRAAKAWRLPQCNLFFSSDNSYRIVSSYQERIATIMQAIRQHSVVIHITVFHSILIRVS